ncbi:MAG: fasciclin domain-containing protein [Planctomycetota bacterium]
MIRSILLAAAAATLFAAPAVAGNCQASCPASQAAAHHDNHWAPTHAVSVTTVSHESSSLPNLAETAVAAGKFNTLVAAAQAAGLVDALAGDGDLTVFAPTDEAFAKIPAATIESLLKPENKEQLAAILTYHIVPGRVLASDVVNLRSAKTLQGGDVAIGVGGDRVFVNNAQVVKTDVEASNGVIHVIDTVLMPAN